MCELIAQEAHKLSRISSQLQIHFAVADTRTLADTDTERDTDTDTDRTAISNREQIARWGNQSS